MRITALFLDMDGVLADFIGPACRLHGFHETPTRYAVWDQMGISSETFWQPIRDAGTGFWETLPRMPYADHWIDLVKSSGLPWCILTKVSKHGWVDTAVGKHRWLMRNYGPLVAEKMVPCGEKWLHGGVGKLLIDDCHANAVGWMATGGESVVPDRPWNESRFEDEICFEIVKELLRR